MFLLNCKVAGSIGWKQCRRWMVAQA